MNESIVFKPKQFNYTVLPRLLDTINSLEQDKEYKIELGKVRKKRSLNANGYMWELCEQIAQKLNITKEDVYRQAIKDVGVFQTVEINGKAENTLKYSWSLHGIGWITETVDDSKRDGFKIVNLYYGSSTYNTKQMSRLIDHIVQDAKAVGIEVISDSDRALLLENWGNGG